MTMRIGIDLGGTKTEIAVLDGRGGIVFRKRVATPSGDYRGTLSTLHGLVLEAEAEVGTKASVGVATPGALSPATGLLRNSNSVCLNGQPFKADLEQVLGRPVRLENDANCFALSEAVDGAGAGAGTVFGVILGTGVGGGIVVGGRLLRGANSIAGEWGHNPLPRPLDSERPGPACYCGRQGCIETFLSGPGLAADHRAVTGRMRNAEQVVADALSGDPAAEATLVRYEERLARALSGVINILDPDVIVLGGGLANVHRWYETLPRVLEGHVFSDVVRTRVLRHHHGDSGGVRGAAWLWD